LVAGRPRNSWPGNVQADVYQNLSDAEFEYL
jgi:hypothetical protein